eukprot:TRINITY_DN6875_c0_g2_i1.p2 TRINITY_DN6875_c0_g2~~TRINITY_DN6875_c0_g2_i1.p2  ORF type:complete len:370 (-),score=20.36 TRINITY_DN6875_c0_g2_i1:467-1576(-)
MYGSPEYCGTNAPPPGYYPPPPGHLGAPCPPPPHLAPAGYCPPPPGHHAPQPPQPAARRGASPARGRSPTRSDLKREQKADMDALRARHRAELAQSGLPKPSLMDKVGNLIVGGGGGGGRGRSPARARSVDRGRRPPPPPPHGHAVPPPHGVPPHGAPFCPPPGMGSPYCPPAEGCAAPPPGMGVFSHGSAAPAPCADGAWVNNCPPPQPHGFGHTDAFVAHQAAPEPACAPQGAMPGAGQVDFSQFRGVGGQPAFGGGAPPAMHGFDGMAHGFEAGHGHGFEAAHGHGFEAGHGFEGAHHGFEVAHGQPHMQVAAGCEGYGEQVQYADGGACAGGGGFMVGGYSEQPAAACAGGFNTAYGHMRTVCDQ